MPMLTRFSKLPPTLILSPIICFSKKRLFEEIAECASYITEIPTEQVITALNDREKMGSTVCAKSIAIPHAIILSAPKDFETFGILCMLSEPIAFNTVDTDPLTIDMAYAFFISHDDSYEDVQNMLYEVSNILSQEALSNSLRLSRYDDDKITAILNKVDSLLSNALLHEEENESLKES